jgi:uncharacterized protein (TIGR02217 family)
MQGFHEIRFPDDISYGAVFGPEFSTDIAKTASDGEQRNQNWAYPRHKGDVAQGVKNDEQLSRLKQFFYNRRGRAYGFRFKDWSDFSAQNQPLGTGGNGKATFQLVKTYTDTAGYTSTRIIKKPVADKITLYVNGVAQPYDWFVDKTTGIITFNTPPTGVITADFEFDVPVRFDNDYMPISIDNFNSYSWDNIPIIELRV